MLRHACPCCLQRAQETKQFTKQNERDEVIDSLRQGEVVAGVVQGVEPYGAFVDIGSGTRALLHISDITGHLTPETLGELFKVGVTLVWLPCKAGVRTCIQGVEESPAAMCGLQHPSLAGLW
jgi:RecJ-like exonuclease